MAIIRPTADRIAVQLAEIVVRFRWPVILITLLTVAAAGNGIHLLEFSNNYRVFFSDKNPELLAFDLLQETYTKNDNILFVLQPKDGKVFSPRTADAVERLTEEAWKIPYAIRVDSVTNFQHSWADGDDLTVDNLIRRGATLSQEELDIKRAIALAEPLLNGSLISPDTGTTGVNVTIQYPERSLTEVPEVVAFARGLANQTRQDFPEIHVALSGISMLNNAFAESGQADAMTLIPLMYVVLIGIILVTLRGLSATFVTILVIGFSTATALGLAGYAGIKLTPISVISPTIILTLAIADSVHILISWRALMREGKDKNSALKESLRINFLAVTITSITTIVGFLALNFSDAPPFWDLGNITAIGIAAAWVYSLCFLPAVISLLPIKVPARAGDRSADGSLMEHLAAFVTTRYRAILLGTGAVSVGLAAVVPTIDLNDQWVGYFDHRIQFRQDAEFAIEHLGGLYQVSFSVEAQGAGGISEPVYLERLEAFSEWLRAQPEVRHVYSFSDIIKRLHKNLHADDPLWYRIPEERELAAQYLLLYELSLPSGLDLNDRISIDKSATRVSAMVEDISTAALRAFLARSEVWLEENTPGYMHTKPTGDPVMFAHISERNIESMLRGNILAVGLIALIMIVCLRSVSLGLLSLIPNAVPILMTFGVWALLVGQVGMAAAAVSATSLGIIVDNTVHFMTKYLRARRERNFDRPDAIRYVFCTVGTAIAANAIILAFGFVVLAASSFKVNAEMGLLTAIAIVLSLVVDFLLLPALLLIGHQKERGTVYA